MSFAVVVRAAGALVMLKQDLAAGGIEPRWEGADTGIIAGHALAGAAIAGIIAAALGGDDRTALYAAVAGAAAGAAVGMHSVYEARLIGTAHLRVLSIEPT